MTYIVSSGALNSTHSLTLPSPPFPLEVSPWNLGRRSEGALKAPPVESGAEPQPKSNSMHFSFKICYQVAGYAVGLQYAVKKYWWGEIYSLPYHSHSWYDNCRNVWTIHVTVRIIVSDDRGNGCIPVCQYDKIGNAIFKNSMLSVDRVTLIDCWAYRSLAAQYSSLKHYNCEKLNSLKRSVHVTCA